MKILIVKASALGDIIQCFPILDDLRKRFAKVTIDWVVDVSLASIVSSHPLVDQVIAVHSKKLKSWRQALFFFRDLRRLKRLSYDVVFDLQGNFKSAMLAASVRSPLKVGFGWRSVRERISLLATNRRFEVSPTLNIRLQYLSLVQQFFEPHLPSFAREVRRTQLLCADPLGVRFRIDAAEREKLREILEHPALKVPCRIMVCPGSKWINKQIPLETLALFLQRVQDRLGASFCLMWGDEAEKAYCTQLQSYFPEHSLVVDKLPLPTWQNLMNEMQLVIAVDSSALHLAGTTSAPSFSLFGPTSFEIFKPIGARHFAFQGPCPYGRTFTKQCPLLRTCPTGACLRNLTVDQIFTSFENWWNAGSLRGD